jgi:hypothetical protein
MGRVLVGAVLGAILGGVLGSQIKYNDATIQIEAQVVSFAKVLHYLSLIAGVAGGGIIGAIAGATSADPQSKPIGIWFWVFLAALLVLAIALAGIYWIMPGGVMEHQPPVPEPMPEPAPPPPGPPVQLRTTIHEYASRSIAPQSAGSADAA